MVLLSAYGGFSQQTGAPDQQKPDNLREETLEKSLPKKVRVFLENADIFEVFGQAERKNGKLVVKENLQYFPNLKTEITDYGKRRGLLNNLYQEVSQEETAPERYLPDHTIRATDGDDIVEIEISFSCRSFFVKGWLGEFSGKLDGQTTETMMNQILNEFGSEY